MYLNCQVFILLCLNFSEKIGHSQTKLELADIKIISSNLLKIIIFCNESLQQKFFTK